MDYTKLKAKLTEDAGKDAALQRIADFTAWLLEKNNHEDIAAGMLGAKKDAPTLEGAFGFARDEARKHAVNGCACIEDKDVYWSVVKYLKLEDCTDRNEIESYCSGAVHTAKPDEVLQANAKSSPFSVDIDSLFD